MARLSVVIVDDEYLVRSGLRLMLDGHEDIAVVAEGANGHEALSLVAQHSPDVVCMDIRMPGMDGIAATRALDTNHVSVIMLTAFDTDNFILDALDAGAAGFLLKDTPPEQVIAAVRQAAAGELRFSPTVLARLVRLAGQSRRADPAATRRLAELTERERDVARAVATGLTNHEVARLLHLSLPTVKTHLGRIFDKLQTTNRVQVALMVHDTQPPSAQ
ncbi:MAG: response regulator [Propioniciclava sp.]